MSSRAFRIGLLALACCAVAPEAHAADPDPWIAKDKALHFGISAGIAGATYAGGAAIFDARGHAMLFGGGVTLAIGAGKELLDLAGYGDPSWKDFAADVAGTLVGLGLAWAVDLAVRGVGDEHPLVGPPSARTSGFAVRF